MILEKISLGIEQGADSEHSVEISETAEVAEVMVGCSWKSRTKPSGSAVSGLLKREGLWICFLTGCVQDAGEQSSTSTFPATPTRSWEHGVKIAITNHTSTGTNWSS